MADHLAHQAVDDYQSMNFEFPDDNIMIVTDCEVPGPDEGPEEGSQWSMHFDGASNALGNGISAVIIYPKGTHTPLTVWYTTCQRLMPETRRKTIYTTKWYELPKQNGFTNKYFRPQINARN